MLAVKFLQVVSVPFVKSSVNKVGCFTKFSNAPQFAFVRLFADDTRQSMWRTARHRRRTFAETISQPAGETAFNVGKMAVAGGSALGLGALCFYGLGLAYEPGTIDNARLWPDYVRERIKDTYMFFAGSVLLTAGSAYAIYNTQFVLEMLTKTSLVAVGLSLVTLIATSMLVQSLPYKEGFGAKHIAWALHSSIVGAILAPLCLAGGPILVRAAWYTLGIVGGLSAIAVCAPSERFLNMGGPLAIGLGVVFVSSLGGMFLPATTALGAGLYSISLYGGLLLFSGFMLYDTQRIIKKAEMHPPYGVAPFDPINASLSIYMDTVNIFIRIVTILSGGNRKR